MGWPGKRRRKDPNEEQKEEEVFHVSSLTHGTSLQDHQIVNVSICIPGAGRSAAGAPYRGCAEANGKLTPTGAIASFPYTPVESMKALRHYYEDCGSFLWGEYGFRDSYDLDENWCSPLFMGLNQAPMVVMIENHRTGLIWKTFMKDPDVRRGLNLLDQQTDLERSRRGSDPGGVVPRDEAELSDRAARPEARGESTPVRKPGPRRTSDPTSP